MAEGLTKLTAAASTQAARADWRKACRLARSRGIEPQPFDENAAGFKRIDRETEKLLNAAGLTWAALAEDQP